MLEAIFGDSRMKGLSWLVGRGGSTRGVGESFEKAEGGCEEVMRQVDIDAPGALFLRSMPGRLENYKNAEAEIKAKGVEIVVRLTSLDEVQDYSPCYAEAIETGALPWDEVEFPVEDWGVPKDAKAFFALANSIATWLREGRRVMVHCLGGIGRTGTLAICVLIALGYSQDKSIRRVKDAGSCPETVEQWKLIDRFSDGAI